MKSDSKVSKLQQLTEAFSDAINQGKYGIDESLPSINETSRALHISRDTVFKAFSELKKRGLVGSTPTKGYYVAGAVQKVFLFLDSYSPFKEALYNDLVKSLPEGYKVELAFHHYNQHVFDAVIMDSIGKYSYYVVINIDNGPISPVLRKLDKNKLLILDWGQYSGIEMAYVCQDFSEAFYSCLKEAATNIKKYTRFLMYRPENCEHPMDSVEPFMKFCTALNLEGKVVTSINEGDVVKGTAWLVFRQKELVEVLKCFRLKGFQTGRDAGIIAYNDSPLYEVVEGGITSISADFKEMASLAASFITEKHKIQKVVKTSLVLRNSL